MISFVQNISNSKDYGLIASGALLVSSYLVGIICIGFGVYPGLVDATGLNLMLTFGLLVYHHEGDRKSLFWFAGLAYAIGFLAELIGVQSGILFGEYSYGRVLGPKLLGTPFLIGVNWSILVLSVGVLMNKYIGYMVPWVKSAIGATLLTAFDFLIEPVATTLNMWSWIGNAVPAQNYVGWFLVSFVMFTLFFKMKISGNNRLAGLCAGLMFIFFLTLNLCLDSNLDIFKPSFTLIR